MKDLARIHNITPSEIRLGSLKSVNRSAMRADTKLDSDKAKQAVSNAIVASNLSSAERNYLVDVFSIVAITYPSTTSTQMREKLAKGGSIFTAEEISEDETIRSDEKLMQKLIFATTLSI